MSKVSKITREEWRKDTLRDRSDFTEEELLSHISILLDEVEDLEELNKMVKERQSEWDELGEMYSKEAERAEKAEFSLGIANAALSILQNEVDTNE